MTDSPATGRRSYVAAIASIAIHVALVGGFVHALGSTRHLEWIRSPIGAPPSAADAVRHLDLAQLDADESPTRQPQSSDTLIRPVDAAHRPAAESPQRGEPAQISTAPERRFDTTAAIANDDVRPDDRSGTAAGDSSAGVQLRPIRTDRRLWSGASEPTAMPVPTRAEVLESSVARAVRSAVDSVAALGVQTVHPDWVMTRNGQRFGIDNERIHLGKVALPAVLLGLLPIPNYGCMPTLYMPERPVRDSAGLVCITLENPSHAERRERIAEMSAEIRARAEVTSRGREEIARIAARKDRERAKRAASPPP